MSDFKPGDVVRLKSGGPKMTLGNFVELGDNPRTAYCCWFDGGKMEIAEILLLCLEKIEDEKSFPELLCSRNNCRGKLLDPIAGSHFKDVACQAIDEGYDGFLFNDVVLRIDQYEIKQQGHSKEKTLEDLSKMYAERSEKKK
jgi:uncharacterized protein YodC (DUF2158 family)